MFVRFIFFSYIFAVKPHMLDEERLTIEFYRIKHLQEENTLLIFSFQPLIAYFDDEHDFVVLELHTTPGVIIRSSRPCVVVIVRGGTPSCFYKNVYPYLPVEDSHKVEYGYAMSDIYLKMFNSTQQNIKDLASEIFRKWI